MIPVSSEDVALNLYIADSGYSKGMAYRTDSCCTARSSDLGEPTEWCDACGNVIALRIDDNDVLVEFCIKLAEESHDPLTAILVGHNLAAIVTSLLPRTAAL